MPAGVQGQRLRRAPRDCDAVDSDVSIAPAGGCGAYNNVARVEGSIEVVHIEICRVRISCQREARGIRASAIARYCVADGDVGWIEKQCARCAMRRTRVNTAVEG